MKILHAVLDGELGGGQLVALALMRGARAAGHEVELASCFRGPFTELAAREDFPVHIVDVSRTFRLGGVVHLRRLLRRGRFDLLHTHGMVAFNVLTRAAARWARVPVVCHLHGPNVFSARPLVGALQRSLDRRTARLCAALVAVSEETRRRYAAEGIPAASIDLVHNGFDAPEAVEAADLRTLGIEGGPVIACVGRLEPAKGQADLLEAAARLREVRVLLVGRDVHGHRGELERLAERRGLAGRVGFAGERADVLALMAACDIVAVPSWTEGFPLAPLEAMAVRRPVVAAAVGGIPEQVEDGATGLLVPPRDPQRLTEALGRLLADPALSARLGEAGYAQLAERFSERRMVESVLALYERAGATRRRP